MDKTITQLSADYFEAADNMACLIKKCTDDIKNAKGDLNKIYKLKQKRLIYYSQKRELTDIAYKLQNYYKKEESWLESA